MEKEIVSFDLFKLHLPTEDKSSYQWVCACGKGLDDELKKLLEECKCNKYEISKNISKKFRLSNSTVQKMLYNGDYIPLLVIREIVKEWAKRLSKSNSYVFNNDMKYWRVPSRPESKIIGLELPK